MRQSHQSSLEHLRSDTIDAYVLHGPKLMRGLHDADWQAWNEMETLQKEGSVRYLGISNVSVDQLAELYEGAAVKPTFVQNRCIGARRWDPEVRSFCAAKGIVYQGFSLLTAGPELLRHPIVRSAATRHNKTYRPRLRNRQSIRVPDPYQSLAGDPRSDQHRDSGGTGCAGH